MQEELQLSKAERQRLVASLVERKRLGTQQELLDALEAPAARSRRRPSRATSASSASRSRATRSGRLRYVLPNRERRIDPREMLDSLLEPVRPPRRRRAERRRRPGRDRVGSGDRPGARPARASARRRHARRRRHVPRDRDRPASAPPSSPSSSQRCDRLSAAARAHGCAASSCAASRKSIASPAGGPISWIADRQPVDDVERDRRGRLPGHVDDRRERRELAAARELLPRIVGLEHPADRHRQLRERRRQHDVDVVPERDDAARGALQRADRLREDDARRLARGLRRARG